MKILALVVLYDNSLRNSSTITSVLENKLENTKLLLIIWNNGPAYLAVNDMNWLKEKCISLNIELEIYQDVRNLALSKIYNFVLNKVDQDIYVILDDDSNLPVNFLGNLIKNSHFDLMVPLIVDMSVGKIVFPYNTKTNKVFDTEGLSLEVKDLMSIGSGLAISRRLVDLFKQQSINVFNEHFAFYGVDSMFFWELWTLSSKGHDIKVICVNNIKHSLSASEEETSCIKVKRKLEELYAKTLVQIHYHGKSRQKLIKKVIKKFVAKELTLKESILLIRCIVMKKHPRARFQIKE